MEILTTGVDTATRRVRVGVRRLNAMIAGRLSQYGAPVAGQNPVDPFATRVVVER